MITANQLAILILLGLLAVGYGCDPLLEYVGWSWGYEAMCVGQLGKE